MPTEPREELQRRSPGRCSRARRARAGQLEGRRTRGPASALHGRARGGGGPDYLEGNPAPRSLRARAYLCRHLQRHARLALSRRRRQHRLPHSPGSSRRDAHGELGAEPGESGAAAVVARAQLLPPRPPRPVARRRARPARRDHEPHRPRGLSWRLDPRGALEDTRGHSLDEEALDGPRRRPRVPRDRRHRRFRPRPAVRRPRRSRPIARRAPSHRADEGPPPRPPLPTPRPHQHQPPRGRSTSRGSRRVRSPAPPRSSPARSAATARRSSRP